MTDNLSNDMFKMVVDSEGGAMEPSVVVDGFMDLVEVQACCCGKMRATLTLTLTSRVTALQLVDRTWITRSLS